MSHAALEANGALANLDLQPFTDAEAELVGGGILAVLIGLCVPETGFQTLSNASK